MSGISVSSIFTVIMLMVVIFGGMQIVGNNIASNTNLDTDSQALIGNFSDVYDRDLNVSSSFDESASALSANASFDSADDFSREFLEGRSEGNKKQGIISNAIKIPDLIILSLGVPQGAVLWLRSIILLVITTILAFALYRSFFGGGKVTEK